MVASNTKKKKYAVNFETIRNWKKKPLENILIIGPSKAGKTALLGCLNHMADNRYQKDCREGEYNPYEDGIQIMVFPRSDPMAELFELTAKTIAQGRLPIKANEETTEYKFEFEVRLEWFSCSPFNATFSCLDGPGGALFPNEALPDDTDFSLIEKFRKELIERLKRTEALIICIDPNDEESCSLFYQCMPRILTHVQRPAPWKYLLFCLTKTDKYFLNYGREALATVNSSNPFQTCHKLLGTAGVNTILKYVGRQTKVGACWCSAYGFVEETGEANYNQAEDKLLIYGPFNSRIVIEKWRPYQVIDPLVYLTARINGGIHFMKVKL